jgi:hypothetical protein
MICKHCFGQDGQNPEYEETICDDCLTAQERSDINVIGRLFNLAEQGASPAQIRQKAADLSRPLNPESIMAQPKNAAAWQRVFDALRRS